MQGTNRQTILVKRPVDQVTLITNLVACRTCSTLTKSDVGTLSADKALSLNVSGITEKPHSK